MLVSRVRALTLSEIRAAAQRLRASVTSRFLFHCFCSITNIDSMDKTNYFMLCNAAFIQNCY